MKSSIIKTKEIKSLYRDYCQDNEIKFSSKKFEDFLRFLKIDFYDWVRENLRQFSIEKEGKWQKVNATKQK